jgi:cystathionine gamma-synthase
MLFPSKKIAEYCRAFLLDKSPPSGSLLNIRLIHLLMCTEDQVSDRRADSQFGCDQAPVNEARAHLHLVLVPADTFPLARLFWQHSGLGISSRLAEYCLSMLPNEPAFEKPHSPAFSRFPCKGFNKHYSNHLPSPKRDPLPSSSQVILQAVKPVITTRDQDVYVEERYGRNLPLTSAPFARTALRRRIAGVLVRDDSGDGTGEQVRVGDEDVEIGSGSRGVADITENDVFLFSSGMAAIWNAHHLLSSIRPPAKSVCFG